MISEIITTFAVSYLTCETPQKAEIRTVAKSLPDSSQNPANWLIAKLPEQIAIFAKWKHGKKH